MALKDNWIDKVDGVDYVMAEDINNIADSVIELEDKISEMDGGTPGNSEDYELLSNKQNSVTEENKNSEIDYPSMKAMTGYAAALSNMVSEISGNETDDKYPSAKAMFDFVENKTISMESQNNKQNSVTEENKNSEIDYPSMKAMTGYVDSKTFIHIPADEWADFNPDDDQDYIVIWE